MAESSNQELAEVLAEYSITIPQPLPSNRKAWLAFVRVHGCRRAGFGLMLGPAWADIAAVLELHNQWNPETQTKLELCFAELVRDEQEQRKAKPKPKGKG